MELTERGVRHWALGRARPAEWEAEHGQSLPHCCPGGLDITNTSMLGILVRKQAESMKNCYIEALTLSLVGNLTFK